MKKSIKQIELEKKIIAYLNGKAAKVAEYIFQDKEIQEMQEYANVVSIKRLGFNDHGPVHMRKAALNAMRIHQGLPEVDAFDFLTLVKDKVKLLEMDEKFLYRSVNEGFSGGEKKRNEILQAAILEPSMCILDETDSGLDIDALQVVAAGINSLRAADRSFLMITHYQRLLDYIKPDIVHVLADGRIVKTGGPELALELEEKGYSWVQEQVA